MLDRSDIIDPTPLLRQDIRRHVKAGGKLHNHRLAYYALRSVIRARGYEETVRCQWLSLARYFGRQQANALLAAASAKRLG